MFSFFQGREKDRKRDRGGRERGEREPHRGIRRDRGETKIEREI